MEPTPAASVPAAASETQDPAPSAPSAPSDPAPAAAPTEAPPEAPAPALGASFLSGEALQTTIRNMEEMGFPRDQVLRALRASYNNPDRAVEYLFNVRINIMSAIQCLTSCIRYRAFLIIYRQNLAHLHNGHPFPRSTQLHLPPLSLLQLRPLNLNLLLPRICSRSAQFRSSPFMNLLSDPSFTFSWLSNNNNNLLVLFLTFQVLLQVWILYAATPDSLRSSNSPHRIPPCYSL